MLFSSMIFLWLFLPFVLVVNLLLPIRLSNFFLLAMSFIFYAWGEQEYIWLLLLSLAVNYAGALGIEAVRGSRPAATGAGAAEAGPEAIGAGAAETGPEVTGAGLAGAGAAGEAAGAAGVTAGTAVSTDSQTASGAGKHALFIPDKLLLVLLVAVNLGFLGYFKYFDFLTGLVNKLAGGTVAEPKNLLLPVGISFYTFQMISYVADVYRGTTGAERNLLNLGLYMSFFPKMIQGPIERYQGMGARIRNRHVTPELFACGARRFIYGLGKKVILANQFGSVVDKVLANPMDQISGGLGWYVGILYTLQIYFDFSGYSDMAVGLGKMLGFELTENFNYPYLARSVGEFWRRWHISLSSWFKDYLYIPLGGSRKGTFVTCRNLMIVFICTGFWHGAGLSFIAWGMYYGCLQVAERLFLKRRLECLPAAVSYIYMFFVTVVGWTMFRADSLTRGLMLLKQMFLLRPGIYDTAMYMSHKTIVYMVIGIVLCGPFQALVPCFKKHMQDGRSIYLSESLGLILLFAYSIVMAVGSTYNPFIYFRF